MKRAIANFFFAVSRRYIRAKRVVDGVALEYATESRPFAALLLSIITCAMLHPVHLYGPLHTIVGLPRDVHGGFCDRGWAEANLHIDKDGALGIWRMA